MMMKAKTWMWKTILLDFVAVVGFPLKHNGKVDGRRQWTWKQQRRRRWTDELGQTLEAIQLEFGTDSLKLKQTNTHSLEANNLKNVHTRAFLWIPFWVDSTVGKGKVL